MRSALACLGLKQTKKADKDKDEDELSDYKDIKFGSWHPGGKGDGTAPQMNGLRYFLFEELQMYTDNFSEANLIGRGGFGETYTGYLTNGLVVAVKRSSMTSWPGVKEFRNEIELLSRIHHKNIVSLVGFCFEQGERILVYEYISNGSLYNNLHGRIGIPLDWKRRLQIALDSARGLAYLHELTNPQIIHRDVKPTNILLDEHLNAKFINFGLSKLNRGDQERHISSQDKRTLLRIETEVAGTLSYLDPEYMKTGELSEKSDVYSFGVVMLELITAKKPREFDENDDHVFFLTEKVKTSIDWDDQEYYGLRDLIDSKIVSQARNIGLRKFLQLALACIEESASDRPFMSEVMKEIDTIILQNDEGATTSAGYSNERITVAF